MIYYNGVFSTSNFAIAYEYHLRTKKPIYLHENLKVDMKDAADRYVADMIKFFLDKNVEGVIGGSISLYLHGLLERLPNDIDAIVPRDFSLENTTDIYTGETGVKDTTGKYKIDYLYGDNIKFIDYNFKGLEFKLGDPAQAIQARIKYGKSHRRLAETLKILEQCTILFPKELGLG